MLAGGGTAAYDSPEAADAGELRRPELLRRQPDNQFAKYVYDDSNRGVSTKPGVTAELVQSTDTECRRASARYTRHQHPATARAGRRAGGASPSRWT